MLDEVTRAVKRIVTVSGVLCRPVDGPWPTRVHVRTLDVHPCKESLPTLSDLRGMAPNITGEQSAAKEF